MHLVSIRAQKTHHERHYVSCSYPTIEKGFDFLVGIVHALLVVGLDTIICLARNETIPPFATLDFLPSNRIDFLNALKEATRNDKGVHDHRANRKNEPHDGVAAAVGKGKTSPESTGGNPTATPIIIASTWCTAATTAAHG